MTQNTPEKNDCELYDHIPVHSGDAMWFCKVCKTDLEFVPTKILLSNPPANSPDDVIEGIMREFRSKLDDAHVNIYEEGVPLFTWLRTILHLYGENIRKEERNKIANEVIESFGEFLAFSGKEAGSPKLMAVEIKEQWGEHMKQEGRSEVLAQLEERMPEPQFTKMPDLFEAGQDAGEKDYSDKILSIIKELKENV